MKLQFPHTFHSLSTSNLSIIMEWGISMCCEPGACVIQGRGGTYIFIWVPLNLTLLSCFCVRCAFWNVSVSVSVVSSLLILLLAIFIQRCYYSYYNTFLILQCNVYIFILLYFYILHIKYVRYYRAIVEFVFAMLVTGTEKQNKQTNKNICWTWPYNCVHLCEQHLVFMIYNTGMIH